MINIFNYKRSIGIFKWHAKGENQCSILIIETERCGKFFDEFSLDKSYRVRAPWEGGVVHVNIEIIKYFIYFLFKKSSFSRPRRMLMSAWVYAMSKATNANKIVSFYLSSRPILLTVAQLNHDISIHCIYPYLVTDNKSINIHKNIFHYVHDSTDVKRLINRNASQENIVITGSPYLSLYKRCLNGKHISKQYDICLISQVVEERLRGADYLNGYRRPLLTLDKSQYHQKVDRASRNLLETLNSLYRDNLFKGRLCIALRHSGSKEIIEKEKNYFLNILTHVDVNFIENNPQLYSSYYAMEQSSVGLTLNSTVAYNMRYIGIESIFAIDEDIEYGPLYKDIKYYFRNGSSKDLLSVLKKISREKLNVSPSLSVFHQKNKCNSIENISALLNKD